MTLLFSHPKAIAKPLSIITSQWEKYTNPDGTGIYFEILNEVYGKGGYEFKLAPWKRAQEEFKQGKFGALLGEAGGIDYCNYPKWPIDADFYSAFYKKSKIPSYPGLSKLPNFRVVWVRGYDIGSYAPGLKPFAEVDNLEQGMKMIAGGRADILIDYDQDMRDLRHQLSLADSEFEISPSDISGGYIYLCFKKDSAVDKGIQQFDEKMSSMEKSGKLKAIFLGQGRGKNYDKIVSLQSKAATPKSK
jgi:polar amino acid transport system substrate-binding protein